MQVNKLDRYQQYITFFFLIFLFYNNNIYICVLLSFWKQVIIGNVLPVHTLDNDILKSIQFLLFILYDN